MALGKTLTVYLAADLSKFNRGMKDAQGTVGGFAGGLDRYLTPALIGASAAAGAFAVKLTGEAISAASDLGETTNKVGVIFGDAAGQITAFADNAVQQLGQTRQTAMDAAATFAQFGKAAGLSGTDLAGFSTQLVQLSADLASFNNASPAETIAAIGAGLRGEAEPLRRFGVLLDDATLKSRAMSMGIYEGTGTLNQQQKVLAAQAEILAQTTDAQGDFARTSDGLANTQRILTAAVEDAKAEIGTGLVMAIEAASSAIGGPQGMADQIDTGATYVGDLTYGIGVLIQRLGELKKASQEAADGEEEGDNALLGWVENIRTFAQPNFTVFLDLLRAVGITAKNTGTQIDTAYDSGVRLAELDRQNAKTKMQLSRELAASAYDSGIAALAEQKRIEKLTEILGHAPGVYEEVIETKKRGGSASKALSEDEKKLTEAFDAQTTTVNKNKNALTDQIRVLEDATKAISTYVDNLTEKITTGFDLGAGFKLGENGKADAKAWVAGVDGEVKKVEWYGNVLAAVKRDAGTNGEALTNYLVSKGWETAAVWGQALIDNGLVAEMGKKLALVQATAKTTAESMVPEFLLGGQQQAEASLQGMASTLAQSESKLRKIGEAMGKPIGAELKASIVEAFADAVTAANDAKTVAGAVSAAKAARADAKVTAQTAAQVMNEVLSNANKRAGYYTTADLYAMGVLH